MDKACVEKNNLEITEDLMRKQAITTLKLKEKPEHREVFVDCRKYEFYFNRSMSKGYKTNPRLYMKEGI